MADPTTSSYQRLARSRFGLNGSGTLWLGVDHLLVARTLFATEYYRRFYFSDIQGFVVRRTARRLIWNLVVVTGAVVCAASTVGLLAAFQGEDDKVGRVFLACAMAFFVVVGLVCVVVAIANTVLGPGCLIFVQTPRGQERLTIPGRLPAFRQLAARLEPLIAAVQARRDAPDAPVDPASSEVA